MIFLKLCSINNIIRIYNQTVRFSKFTLSIEIYEVFVEFLSKLVSLQTSLERNFVPPPPSLAITPPLLSSSVNTLKCPFLFSHLYLTSIEVTSIKIKCIQPLPPPTFDPHGFSPTWRLDAPFPFLSFVQVYNNTCSFKYPYSIFSNNKNKKKEGKKKVWSQTLSDEWTKKNKNTIAQWSSKSYKARVAINHLYMFLNFGKLS